MNESITNKQRIINLCEDILTNIESLYLNMTPKIPVPEKGKSANLLFEINENECERYIKITPYGFKFSDINSNILKNEIKISFGKSEVTLPIFNYLATRCYSIFMQFFNTPNAIYQKSDEKLMVVINRFNNISLNFVANLEIPMLLDSIIIAEKIKSDLPDRISLLSLADNISVSQDVPEELMKSHFIISLIPKI